MPPVKVLGHVAIVGDIEYFQESTNMARQFKPDPYNGFKDDRERRRALNARAGYFALACVAFALIDPKRLSIITWLIDLVCKIM